MIDLDSLEFRVYPDPILTKECEEFELPLPENIEDLAELMFATMYEHNGIGLAASQLGLTKRILIYHVNGEKRVLINPVIVSSKNKIINEGEGCLSFPGIKGDVERNEFIDVEAIDEKENKIAFSADGIESIVIQHEIDHLNGITLARRFKPMQMMKVKKLLRSMEENYNGKMERGSQ